MKHLEYKVLRQVCGAYHGSSHTKLLATSAVESLKDKLDDLSICWAACSLCTGNPHIRQSLESKPATGKNMW